MLPMQSMEMWGIMFPPEHLDNDTIEDADRRHGTALDAGDVHRLERIPVSYQEITPRSGELAAKNVRPGCAVDMKDTAGEEPQPYAPRSERCLTTVRFWP